MNYIEQLHLEAIDTNIWLEGKEEYENADKAATKSAKITKQIAIEFTEWCVINANPIAPNECFWNLRTDISKELTTSELYQEFLKTKEIKLPDLTWKDASKEEIKSKELKSMKGKEF